MLAIILTIMVLEIKVPHGADFAALKPLLPVVLSYVLSFIYIGIYWNNHHMMLAGTPKVSGSVLWANLHLLFWLSLVPFVTGWMGENHFSKATLVMYGVVLFMAGLAYTVLQYRIIATSGPHSVLAQAVGDAGKARHCRCYTRWELRLTSGISGQRGAFTWPWRLGGWCPTRALSGR